MDWHEFLERATEKMSDNQAASMTRRELHAHLLMLTEDLQAQGFPLDEALKEALIRMGNPEDIRDSFSPSPLESVNVAQLDSTNQRGFKNWFIKHWRTLSSGSVVGICASFLPFTRLSGIVNGRSLSTLLMFALICALLYGIGEPVWAQVRGLRVKRSIVTANYLWISFTVSLIIGAFVAKRVFWYMSGVAQLLNELIAISALIYVLCIASRLAVAYWKRLQSPALKVH